MRHCFLKKHKFYPPPPTLGFKNRNKGMEDILDIYSQCPDLQSGETTFHLTNKWRGIFNISKIHKKIQTSHQYQKLYSTPPRHGARTCTCKVLRKYSKHVYELVRIIIDQIWKYWANTPFETRYKYLYMGESWSETSQKLNLSNISIYLQIFIRNLNEIW